MLEDDGRVVSNFIVQALRGEPLTLYGKGTNAFLLLRNDLIEALIKLMNVADVHDPVNLGNPGELLSRTGGRGCQICARVRSGVSPLRKTIRSSASLTSRALKRCSIGTLHSLKEG